MIQLYLFQILMPYAFPLLFSILFRKKRDVRIAQPLMIDMLISAFRTAHHRQPPAIRWRCFHQAPRKPVREPAVFGSAMPVLDACRDHYCVAFVQLAGFFAPFLIPAAAADAQQHLSAAFVGMMDMPVVAAARFKRHVGDEQSFAEHRIQIALTDEILPQRHHWACPARTCRHGSADHLRPTPPWPC